MEPEIGSLECGKLADIVMGAGNPLEDVSLLAQAQNIKVVMQNGVIKNGLIEG